MIHVDGGEVTTESWDETVFESRPTDAFGTVQFMDGDKMVNSAKVPPFTCENITVSLQYVAVSIDDSISDIYQYIKKEWRMFHQESPAFIITFLGFDAKTMLSEANTKHLLKVTTLYYAALFRLSPNSNHRPINKY